MREVAKCTGGVAEELKRMVLPETLFEFRNPYDRSLRAKVNLRSLSEREEKVKLRYSIEKSC